MRSRQEYQEHGLEPIPIRPNTKWPMRKGWPDRPISRLWSRVGENANIGLRGTSTEVMIDCDDMATAEYLRGWFDSLGLSRVGEVTRQGTHLYVRTEVPDGFHTAKLSDGSGELRGPRSYVVAAPSIVDGFEYQPFGDLARIPVVEWDDLSKWVVWKEPKLRESDAPPIPVLQHRLPQRADELITAIRNAQKGEQIEHYDSRSEAMAALLHIVIGSGYGPETVISLIGDAYDWRRIVGDYSRILGMTAAEPHSLRAEYLYRHAEKMIPRETARQRQSYEHDVDVLKAVAVVAWGKQQGWMLHVTGVLSAYVGLLPPTSPTVSSVCSVPLLQDRDATGHPLRRDVWRSLKRFERHGLLKYETGRGWELVIPGDVIGQHALAEPSNEL